METHTYPHFPTELSTVHIALYSNVSNAAEVRRRLVSAASLPEEDGEGEREAMNYAFVNAKLISSRLHIQTAVYQAILADAQGSLRTKTVHSEVLWALNPSHNISEAIKRFGVSDSTQSVLVIRICSPSFTGRDFEKRVGLVMKGDLVPLPSLEWITDWPHLRKYYKLNAEPAVDAFVHSVPTKREGLLLDQLIVSSVATKSVST